MDDLNKRVWNDSKVSDEFIKQQKSKGRSPYTFNDDISDLESFGLTKHKPEWWPQTIYFLTPEEVVSFEQEELRVFNLLKKLDNAKETIIKYMDSVIRKKIN